MAGRPLSTGPMPKRYGVKEKDQVVYHIVNLVLTGKLRTGDRIDRNEIAEDLGVSRVPIQEAVVQLEHDGLLSNRYHRGTFVERFDEAAVFEQHELYGMLNGIASARAAADPTPEILSQLDALMRTMRKANQWPAFQDAAWQYRSTIADHYAGPRLRAAIRAAQIFLPRAFWVTYQDIHGDVLPFYESENAAIHRHDPNAAQAACRARSEVMAQAMLAELVRRRVFPPSRVGRPSRVADRPTPKADTLRW